MSALTDNESQMLREMHGAIIELAEGCKHCRPQVKEHHVVLNGIPGEVDHPGIATRVDRLEGFQGRVRWGLRALWAVLLLALGAVITRAFGG